MQTLLFRWVFPCASALSLPARGWEGTVTRCWLALTGRGIGCHADDVLPFENLLDTFTEESLVDRRMPVVWGRTDGGLGDKPRAK